MKKKPLKSLWQLDKEQEGEVFGEKYDAPIPKTGQLKKTCPHKKVTLTSSTTIRCECGAGWQGGNIERLYKAMTSQ